MTNNTILKLIIVLTSFLISCGESRCQAQETNDAKLILDAIYANGLLSNAEVMELLHDQDTGVLFAELYGQENAILHLIAKRGYTSSLYVLLLQLPAESRQAAVARLNTSFENHFLVQHYIIIGMQSPYWIEQFRELGLDFSIPPDTEEAVKRLKSAVMIRWGSETEAYQAHLALVKGDDAKLKSSLSLQERIDQVTAGVQKRRAVSVNAIQGSPATPESEAPRLK